MASVLNLPTPPHELASALPDFHLKSSNPLADLLFEKIRFVNARLPESDLANSIPYEPINASSTLTATQLSYEPVPSTSKLPPLQSSEATFVNNGDSSSKLSSHWPNSIHRPGPGLDNHGNTCYLNASLQALIHSPAFVTLLLSNKQHLRKNCPLDNSNKFCALCSMYSMMESAFVSGRGGSRSPQTILANLRKIAPHFRTGRQEDAHEFLRFLLDAMQASCLANHSPAALKAKPSLREKTIIHRVFGGRFRSRIHCHACKNNSDTFDSFLDLSVPVAQSATLENSFDLLTRPDELRGQNKYKCEQCKKLVDARKQLSIDQAPHVLTVHLKRFTPAGRKLASTIVYPEQLALLRWMSDQADNPRYRLDAIISHAGSGLHSGHYYSTIRTAHNKWCRFDDSTVHNLTNPSHNFLSIKTAYILIYTRIDLQSEDLTQDPPFLLDPVNLKRKKGENFSSQQSVTDPSQSQQSVQTAYIRNGLLTPPPEEYPAKKIRSEEDVGYKVERPMKSMVQLGYPQIPQAVTTTQVSPIHAMAPVQSFYATTQNKPKLISNLAGKKGNTYQQRKDLGVKVKNVYGGRHKRF